MGKDLNGNDLGKWFSQRPDGTYNARRQINKEPICLYDSNLAELRKKFKKEIERIKQKQLHISIPEDEQTLNEWFEFWYDRGILNRRLVI